MDGQPLDLRSIFAVLRRQARLISLVVLVVLGAAVLAILVLKPQYTASALVLVDPSQKNLLDPNSAGSGSNSESARVDSEVELVKSRATLMSVVQSEQLISDPSLGPRLGWTAELLAFLNIRKASLPSGEEALGAVVDNLDRATSASRRGETFLISIDATTGDPATSARIANALATAYIRSQLDSKVNAAEASRDILRARIAGASKSIVDSEQAFDRFLAETVEAVGNAKLDDLRKQIEALTSDNTRLEAAVTAADQGLRARDWTTVAQSLQLDALSQLEAERRDLEARLSGAATGSQTAIDLRQSLADLEANMSQAADTGMADLRQRITASQQRADDLRQELRGTLLKSNLPAYTLTRIYELQQNSQIARNQYDTLLGRLADLENQAFLQIADSRIASLAAPPNGPSFPNPRLILVLAAIAAISLGIGLAFTYENYLGGFTSEAQATAVLRVPFVSSVPHQRLKPGGNLHSHADLIMSSPLSAYSESVRRVRLSADLAAQRAMAANAPQGERGMVLMVTSVAPKEGKTTLALALSRVFTVSGKSTLLIDCDLRNPRLHQYLGIEPSAGLMDYLRRADNAPLLSSILTQDELGGTAVAIGARTSASPTDQLVAGETFGRLLTAATKAFDVVILDTPPVGPVVDALYLARFVDGIVFTVKWATTQQTDVRRAIAALNAAKRPEVEIIGVLQQVQGARRARKHGDYYDYYQET